MIVKDATDGSTNRVSLGLKCGECVHLSGTPVFEKVCSQLGKTSFADACKEFTPDLAQMTFVKKGDIKAFSEIANRMSQKQLRLMSFVCRNADLIKKAGYSLGETVVFSLGGDYLECYVRGEIIGADRRGQQVYVVSDFESLNINSALMTLMKSSIMSMPEFIKKRKELILEGRIAEPKNPKASRKRTTLQCLRMSADERAVYRERLATKPDSYEPPSIDTVPAAWLDSRMLDIPVAKRTGAKAPTAKKTGKAASDGKSFSLNRHGNKAASGSRAKAKPKTRKASKG